MPSPALPTWQQITADERFTQAPLEERRAIADDYAELYQQSITSDPQWKPEYRADLSRELRDIHGSVERSWGEATKDVIKGAGKSLAYPVAGVAGVMAEAPRSLSGGGSPESTALVQGLGRRTAQAVKNLTPANPDAKEAFQLTVANFQRQLDEGDHPQEAEGFVAWLNQRDADVRKAAAAFNAEESPAAYDHRSLAADPARASVLARYLRTRNPATFNAYVKGQSDSLVGEATTREQAKANAWANQQQGALAMIGGNEWANEVRDFTSDPLELASTALETVGVGLVAKGAAKLAKGEKAAVAGAEAAAHGGMDTVKHLGQMVLGEAGLEYVQAVADHPAATEEEKRAAFRDGALIALVLGGLGAAPGTAYGLLQRERAKAALDARMTPPPAQTATPPPGTTAAAPSGPASGTPPPSAAGAPVTPGPSAGGAPGPGMGPLEAILRGQTGQPAPAPGPGPEGNPAETGAAGVPPVAAPAGPAAPTDSPIPPSARPDTASAGGQGPAPAPAPVGGAAAASPQDVPAAPVSAPAGVAPADGAQGPADSPAPGGADTANQGGGPPGKAFALPPKLAGAKPGFGYRDKTFALAFEDPLDQALYILAQDKRSKNDAAYLKAVIEQTGMSEEQAREAGKAVKARLKEIAKGSAAGPMAVPVIHRADSARLRQLFTPNPRVKDAAERAHETAFLNQITADPEGALKAYAQLPGSEGGTNFDVDVARELYAPYQGDKGGMSEATHGPASALIELALDRKLKGKPTGQPVLVMMGGPGSGKSTSRAKAAKILQPEFTVDKVLSDPAKAQKFLKSLLDTGRPVAVTYVWRPIESALELARLREVRDKRHVPTEYFPKAHFGAQQTAKMLAGSPMVDFTVVDSATGQEFVGPDALDFLNRPDVSYQHESDVETRYHAARKAQGGAAVSPGLAGTKESGVQTGVQGDQRAGQGGNPAEDSLSRESFGTESSRTSTEAAKGKKGAPPPAPAPRVPTPGSLHVVGPDGKTSTLTLGRLMEIPIVDLPGLVQLARALTGTAPALRNLPKGTWGQFSWSENGRSKLEIDREAFRLDPDLAARVMAHEIGHAEDFVGAHHPDGEKTLSRGNLLGHIVGLKDHMAKAITLPGGKPFVLDATMMAQARALADQRAGPQPADKQAAMVWKGHWLQHLGKARAEVAAQNGGTANHVIKAELETLSKQWRGDWSQAPASHQDYRRSAKELYADALGALLLDSGWVMEVAPTFFQSWVKAMDERPEARQALLETFEVLRLGPDEAARIRNETDAKIYSSTAEAMADMVENRDAAKHYPGRLWDELTAGLFNQFEPLLRRARKAKVDGAWYENIRDVFDLYPAAARHNSLFLDQWAREVQKPLQEAGISNGDVGNYLAQRRIVNDITRLGKANPGGETNMTAHDRLLALEKKLGPEAWGTLVQSVAKLDEMFFELTKEAVQVGYISQETFDQVIVPNRGVYATFLNSDKFFEFANGNLSIPAGIMQATGYLGQIVSPYEATILKAVALRKAIEHQKAKATATNLLLVHSPGEIRPVIGTRDATGRLKFTTPVPRGWSRVELFRAGERVAFDLPAPLATALIRTEPNQLNMALKIWNWLWRGNTYKLLIAYNPIFTHATSPVRDLYRTVRNLQGPNQANVVARGWHLLGAASRSWADVKSMTAGDYTPFLRQAILDGVIPLPQIGGVTDWLDHPPLEKLMEEYNLKPKDPKGGMWWDKDIGEHLAEHKWTAQIGKLAHSMETRGVWMESVTKLGAYRYLLEQGVDRKEAARQARNYAGAPPYLRKGAWLPSIRMVVPFYNVALQGLASDAQAAANHGAEGLGAWTMRFMLTQGIWKVGMAMALAGAFGDDERKRWSKISQHDLLNYLVVPIPGLGNEGGEYGGQEGYLRVPTDEIDRLLGGFLFTAVRMGLTASGLGKEEGTAPPDVSQLANLMGGQVPGVNPFLTIPGDWAKYFQGQEVVDGLGRKVLTKDEALLRGWAGFSAMAGHTASELGLRGYVPKPDPNAATTFAGIINALPFVRTLVKISDAGRREGQRAGEETEDRFGAQWRDLLSPEASQIMTTANRMAALGREDMTPAQRVIAARSRLILTQLQPLVDSAKRDLERGDEAAARRKAYLVSRFLDGWGGKK